MSATDDHAEVDIDDLETFRRRCRAFLAEPPGRFEPAEGTVVEFTTGPGSQTYAGDLESVSVEPAGETEDGFLRYRLSL